jgi:hypothetical protein
MKIPSVYGKQYGIEAYFCENEYYLTENHDMIMVYVIDPNDRSRNACGQEILLTTIKKDKIAPIAKAFLEYVEREEQNAKS